MANVERRKFRAILMQSVYAVLINSVLFHTWVLGHCDDAANNDLWLCVGTRNIELRQGQRNAILSRVSFGYAHS
jgi:hypothetical protein